MTGRLLVVGGGIAGFGLARALSLRGVSCTLVERLSAPSVPGLGLNLPGNAVRALAALGLADEVVDRGMRIRRREYRLAERRDWSRVGAEFERLRRPRVAHVQAATDKMSRIAALPGRLRDVVAPMLGPRAYREAYRPLRTPVAQAVTGG